MLQKSQCASQRLAALGLSSALLFCSFTPRFAWSGETLSSPGERVRDRPDYDTILAEKSSRNHPAHATAPAGRCRGARH